MEHPVVVNARSADDRFQLCQQHFDAEPTVLAVSNMHRTCMSHFLITMSMIHLRLCKQR